MWVVRGVFVFDKDFMGIVVKDKVNWLLGGCFCDVCLIRLL